MTLITEALRLATTALKKTSSSPRIDAELLLSKTLNKTRTFLYTYSDRRLLESELKHFHSLIKKRLIGVPVAYLVGHREFWSLSLKVDENTLIPRPETELLVELVLGFIENKPAQILDLGTGSGAIALACASERPLWKIKAIDISIEALKIAKENASILRLTNVQFCQSNWFDDLKSPLLFDAILSNPPYISSCDQHQLAKELDFEPAIALFSGNQGLDAIEMIISESLARLKPGGLLLIEHGFDQKPAIESMLMNYGYDSIRSWKDNNGHDRVSGGKKRKA